MSVWLNESDLREDVAGLQQLTLNVAFLADIKEDSVRPQELIEIVQTRLSELEPAQIRRLAEDLGQLRDELETHFALEEFYGYFESAELSFPQISARADRLKSQHEVMFLDLCDLVELADGASYGETDPKKSLPTIRSGFHSFVQNFNRHEQEEHELMMRLCNDELGEGD